MRLEASELGCVRGGREVFSGVGFAVGGGEALVVTGRNGAGKSSLLRLIAGLVRIAAGRLTLTGGDQDLPLAEQVHYLGHQDALKPSLTVAENLDFWTRYLAGADINISEALAAGGIDAVANLPAGYLSAGQRRRLSIARLVAVKRPVWLLDEPMSALDRAAQQRLAELMRGHLAGGGIIVAAAHGEIGLEKAKELRLDSQHSPLARSAPSPLAGEGWGGGSQ
jgi:heme exporter protein A